MARNPESTEFWSKKRINIHLSKFMASIHFYVTLVPVEHRFMEMIAAEKAMAGIDPYDAEFLAAALVKKADIWSYDEHFRKQNLVKVVTSEDILKTSLHIPTLYTVLESKYLKYYRKGKRPFFT